MYIYYLIFNIHVHILCYFITFFSQDIYSNLSSAGFSHKQIEQAMESTILHGGDLIDALDWLCLNLTNGR